jgi:hypothetical protein
MTVRPQVRVIDKPRSQWSMRSPGTSPRATRSSSRLASVAALSPMMIPGSASGARDGRDSEPPPGHHLDPTWSLRARCGSSPHGLVLGRMSGSSNISYSCEASSRGFKSRLLQVAVPQRLIVAGCLRPELVERKACEKRGCMSEFMHCGRAKTPDAAYGGTGNRCNSTIPLRRKHRGRAPLRNSEPKRAQKPRH